jgi:hypothetical protein
MVHPEAARKDDEGQSSRARVPRVLESVQQSVEEADTLKVTSDPRSDLPRRMVGELKPEEESVSVEVNVQISVEVTVTNVVVTLKRRRSPGSIQPSTEAVVMSLVPTLDGREEVESSPLANARNFEKPWIEKGSDHFRQHTNLSVPPQPQRNTRHQLPNTKKMNKKPHRRTKTGPNLS